MEKERNLIVTPVIEEVLKRLGAADMLFMMDAIFEYLDENDEATVPHILNGLGALEIIFEKIVKPEIDGQVI